MNRYTFEEMNIGMSEQFDVKITEEQMQMFEMISGDFNPMHKDAEYARRRGYNDKIVYGMLTSSFYSTLVGMYLPGEKCLLNKIEVEYRKPVYVGEILTVFGQVVDKREATRRIGVKAKIINKQGETVNTAKIMVSFTGE